MYSSSLSRATKTISQTVHNAIFTPPPLFHRQAASQDCSEASQSASRASQQAFQQASQSIQQANQSASQAVREASQSASNSIQQANNSASQLIAAASRSSSSVVSSASSAIASIQASASEAVARANGAVQSAQFTASLLQQEVSKAGASATTASEQARESQNAAITATQAAVAIVGSIIASTLLTMLVFWCIIKYRKKKSEEQEAKRNEQQDEYPIDEKTPIPRMRGGEGETEYPRKDISIPRRQKSTSTTSSLSSYDSYTKAMREGEVADKMEPTKETYVAWNPKNPPKAPTLKSWLKFEAKDGVSPFTTGPINLPTSGTDDEKRPLGGQLKSPLSMIPMRSPKPPTLGPSPIKPSTLSGKKISPPRNDQDMDMKTREEVQAQIQLTAKTGEESIWTDDKRSTIAAEESPLQPEGFRMVFPTPSQPVRNTAEWYISQQKQPEPSQPPTPAQYFIRESLLKDIDIDSPSAARASTFRTPKLGVSVSVKSVKGEVHYVNSVKSVKSGKGSTSGSKSKREAARGVLMKALEVKEWEMLGDEFMDGFPPGV